MIGSLFEFLIVIPFTIIMFVIAGAVGFRYAGGMGALVGCILGAIVGMMLDFRLEAWIKSSRTWVSWMGILAIVLALVFVAISTR